MDREGLDWLRELISSLEISTLYILRKSSKRGLKIWRVGFEAADIGVEQTQSQSYLQGDDLPSWEESRHN